MPWYHNIVPESIKKNVCACLLQRYFGQFVEEKIRREQLNVDLYNGTGTVEKINLDIQVLNELSEKQNWPMEFVDGYIEKLYLSVPWTSILKDPSYVEVRGLKITLQPKQRHECATSMFESMWNSMTSSMQLAEEYAKQEAANATNSSQPYEGIELFAQTIESILSRVKVKFIDTVIQIEHVPKDSSTGVGIVINVDLIEYSDESGNDPTPEEATDLTNQDSKKAYIVQSVTTKKFNIQGVTLSTVEFSSKARTFSRSVLLSQSTCQQLDKETEESVATMLNRSTIEEQTEEEETQVFPPVDEKEKTPDPNLNGHRHVIVFGKMNGGQEIRIKLKHKQNLIGPKVSLDMNFGSLVIFLSPRQFHVLLELANGLARPDTEDTSNIPPRARCNTKPMTTMDYQRVEQELQHQLQPFSLPSSGLQAGRGWSTAVLDDSDSEENFLPLRNNIHGMYDSTLSGISSSMESSLNSSIASSATEQTSRTKRRLNNIESDPTAEISHFQIRMASLALILLHEDLLVQPVERDQILALSSVQQMQQTADEFFTKLGHCVPTAYGHNDFENVKDVFDKACSLNHLRLLAAPVQAEGDEKTTLSAFAITGQVSIAKLQLLECLYNTDDDGTILAVPLLSFGENPTFTPSSPSAKPSLRLSFKHIEKSSKCGALNRNYGPRSDISLALNKCTVEFDITIIDRLNALLHRPTICFIEKTKYNPWTGGIIPAPLEPLDTIESRLDVKISSSCINLKLRFPIPDFRPTHDMSRTPWWKRNVRPDYVSFIMTEAVFFTTFQTNQALKEYTIQSRGLDIFYYETENSIPLHIAKAGFDDKLNIKVFPKRSTELEEVTEPEQDPMTTSCYGAFENQDNKEPGPFSAKKVVHESDTPHSKRQKDDVEELIMPGDKAEINEFIRQSSACTKIQVEMFLPTVSLQFKSKHIYELIYNRISNDLLLWSPSAPKPKSVYDTGNHAMYSGFVRNVVAEPDTFTMCKSGIQYDSESDTDSESDNSSNIFYSTYDNRMKFTSVRPQVLSAPKTVGQSYLTLNIQIGQGVMCVNPPVREASTKNVIPGQQGEFMLNLEDANVFVVSGYKGETNLGYVCVQVHNAQLYHCDMISIPSQTPPLKEFGSAPGRHLFPTIYKSEPGMLVCGKNRGGNREMFSVAVKIQGRHETHHVKTVQIAIGLNKSTLRHRVCNEPNSWITHLIDFFKVHDYPIKSYHSKDVLTELHVNLWDCAVDYRPLNIPVRCAITVGNFSLSSHISAHANSSTLRFIFEDCNLFLSERAPPRNGVASSAPVDLKRDYVNVIEVGLFELSLKTSDKKSGVNPHIDLRASNNIVHIHTCADSARMLMQLIKYFASDGDLTKPQPSEDVSGSPRKQSNEQELITVEPQGFSKLSDSQHEHVNEMIGEAMKESTIVEEYFFSDDDLPPTGTKLFFFPDEHHIPPRPEPKVKPLPQVTSELGDLSKRPVQGHESCLGMFPKGGIPEIKWLSGDSLRVVEGHFSIPIGKSDLLKPPKNCPTPVLRYTLYDMSVVWHMYGGNDFKLPEGNGSKKKTVNFSDTNLNDNVSFSNVSKGEVTIASMADKKKASMSWLQKGGVNRDHSVHMELQLNKVRFQHDVYPDTTREASRQVLIVSEVEIRDRLESSQINKFLYQYTSQAMPKQSHAHMVIVKAMHIRPDPKLKTQECCLKISLLPLRLNIDQDALLFLITFFNELSCGGPSKIDEEQQPSSKHSTPTHQPPVMTINDEAVKRQAHKVVNDNLIILIEENKHQQEMESSVSSTTSSVSDCSPVYFRNVVFSPDVLIRLDYHGKRVDMTHGSLPGLLMGLGQLNCSELRLKRINYRHGLLGMDKLISHLLQEWLNDIKKNQLPSLLGGVGPMYSLVQLFQGVRDLFWLPIEQYQKDGRIVRGLQRGANSFTTSTAMAALELTSRIIHLIQITAETAYDILSPGPSVRRPVRNKGGKGSRRRRYHQPQDIREGMTNAIMLVKEGIGETADNIVQVASHEKEQKGYSGAVGGVLRQIPPTILKPIIIASEATSNVLGGMRSQLVPDARREANQKWRSDET
ncbi:unnamed protein product [Acanthoscelides obtectus]|uniref:Autophagy-related protein 2 n=1 Tax=Acanthoscelides obtectus TaxID=200917 RepID=A0A9P0LQ18_ACAOB|nr:unnamed protein product [Acanthoscelides obtectus]CAK1657382.1 Autophagy-related protein 2 homolog B [Acanthoscelides obtectus]